MPLLMLALAGAAVTAQNWRQHPAIREVRAIVQAVDREAAAPRTTQCPDGRTIVRAGPAPDRVRVELGSSDSAASVVGTYDTSGALRFVLIEAGAVNGTHVEYRSYFDARGRRLWLDQRQSGPGYTFTPADFEQLFGASFARLRGVRCGRP